MSISGQQVATLHFRARARMVKILGEDLIRDNTVGLMELVKNGYDADARHVRVELLHSRAKEQTVVIVQDDGTGMTEEIIRGPWFEPAHGGKERQKETQTRTALNRLPLGEKGVGRFATQKLGRILELVTRPQGASTELVTEIDWDAFDDSDQYLDEIEVALVSRSPEVFLGHEHGTRLIMRGARSTWTRREIQRFQASLIRLLSPHEKVKDFQVEFVCPDHPDLENLERDDILERYQYRMDCIISQDGKATLEYRHRQPDGTEQLEIEEKNLWSLVAPETAQYRNPTCGQFIVQLSTWLREVKLLEQYGLTRDQLRILGGVSIYRDGFRILPYGDEGDDWLSLDQRRINKPASRFGNRQIIGIVEIDQVSTPNLVDKTNREGLQENEAFFDFRLLTLGVVESLEQFSLEQRQQTRNKPESKTELKKELQKAKEELRRLQEKPILSEDSLITSSDIQENEDIPDESKNAPSQDEDHQKATDDEVKSAAGPEEFIETEEEMIPVPRETLEAISEHIEAIDQGLDILGDFPEEEEYDRDIYLHLMGIGLAAERFSHEFDRLVDSAGKSIQNLKSGAFRQTPQIEQLETFVNVLRHEVRLMGVLRYVKRSPQARNQSVKSVIEAILEGHEQELQEANIKLELRMESDFEVYMSRASLAQIIDNIVHNAIYWLKQKMEKNDRKLRIEAIVSERTILISNNGPAILPNIRRRLFKTPFVSKRLDGGRGIGMFIAAEIVRRNQGTISLTNSDDPRVLPGAGFSIKLSEPKK